MPFDAPFRLGPFMVDPLGRLQPNAPETSPTVHVRWRGLWISIRLSGVAEPAAVNGVLALAAVIGRVRSTAAGQPAHRAQALETLGGLLRAMPPGWRMRVQADHSARIEASFDISLPATATALLTVITCFLLDLAPYLDLLSEPDAGFEATGFISPSTAGTVNT